MKKLALLVFLLIIANNSQSQIPNLEIQDTSGNFHQLPDYMNDDSNYLISFWATWCTPCKKEFDAWQDYSSNWINNCNVKILGISIDNPSVYDNAIAIWANKGWDGDLLFADADSAQVAFDFQLIPQTFLFDSSGNIVYEHSGYFSGDEIELDQFISDYCSVSTKNEIKLLDEIKIYQDDNSIYLKSSNSSLGNRLNIFSIEGKLVQSFLIDDNSKEFEISKSVLIRKQIYVFELSEKSWRESKLVFVN